MIKFLVAFCILCITINVNAQLPDTIQLKTVNIDESRTSLFTVGSIVTEIDTSIIKNATHQTLGEILSTATGVFVKSYGPGGSATISSRGTEARHSAILWNGFNINSASLGLTDLSLVPVSTTGSISLIHGGSGPVNGNSAIGGVISISNAPALFQKYIQVNSSIEAGSFGNKHLTAGINFGTLRFESRTLVFGNAADNNFEYENIAKRNNPVEEQQHSSFQNFGITQDLVFKVNDNQQLSVALWYQVNRREIPPMMTVPESFAEQRDSLLRTYLGYRIILNKSVLKLNVGYFREHQFYFDPQYNYDLRYDITNYLFDIEWRIQVNEKLIINNGVTYTNSKAGFDEYEGNKSRSQASLFSNAYYEPLQGWIINAGLRKEFTNSENPPLSPSLGLEGNLYKNLILITANSGLHYNLPSMNDLYWVPGGNAELKPEEAWSSEIGLVLFKNHKILPYITASYFHSIVDNWIKWQPASGGIYTPDNLQQVRASGFETTLSYHKVVKQIFISVRINYVFTKSILTESSELHGHALIGKQLIYIPENIINGVLQLQFKSLSFQYNHTFTGLRYVTADNSAYLDSYQVADITVNKSFKIKKNNLNIFLKVMNIYQASYQVLAYRPMPGRWYSCGIKINLNFKNKKNHNEN